MQSIAARNQQTPSLMAAKRKPYEHTRNWLELLGKFTLNMQKMMQTHMRQLKFYPETFTGKQAFDCMSQLLPTIFTNRSNYAHDESTVVMNVFDNYLDEGFIYDVRDEQSRKFDKNTTTLYRLNKPRIDQYIHNKTPSSYGHPSPSPSTPVTRASSVRESSSNSNYVEVAMPEPHLVASRTKVFDSSKWSNNRNLRGRRSMSMQDIAGIKGNKQKETETETPQSLQSEKGETSVRANLSGFVGSITKASASFFSLNRSASQTDSRKGPVRTRTLSNSSRKFLDENVLKDDRQGSSSSNDSSQLRPPTASKGSRSVFSTKTSAIPIPASSKSNPRAIKPESTMFGRDNPVPVFTEADELNFWHDALLSRFKQLLLDVSPSISSTSLLPKQFSGANIRWNCRHVNVRTGIVERLEKNAELSTELAFSLKSLAEFRPLRLPRPATIQTGTGIQINNRNLSSPRDPQSQVLELFATVNSHLAKLAPIIPQETALCLKQIANHFSHNTQQKIVENARLFNCFRLCFLTLPPTRLRYIQILFKYAKRIGNNTSLPPNLNNNSLFSTHFFQSARSTASNSPMMSSEWERLFVFIIDNLSNCLISEIMPKLLEEDVQKLIKSYEMTEQEQIPTPLPSNNNEMPTPFCNRINMDTYEEQKRSGMQGQIHQLLDQIMANEKLSSAEKLDKLKMFRLTYPSIYAERFPPHSDPLNLADESTTSHATGDENAPSSLLRQFKKRIGS